MHGLILLKVPAEGAETIGFIVLALAGLAFAAERVLVIVDRMKGEQPSSKSFEFFTRKSETAKLENPP